MDCVSSRVGNSMDVSGLLKVISGLWHRSFLQLGVSHFLVYWSVSHSVLHTLGTQQTSNSSLEELQHLWAADPFSYYNWSYGKNANLARNQRERMGKGNCSDHTPTKPFLNKHYLAICVLVHQSGCPICATAGDYFVLSSIFFIEFVWNAHMHTNYFSPSLTVVHSLDWPFRCVLSPALSFNLMWIDADMVTMIMTVGFTALLAI